jgi:hypothetical protein
MSIFCMPAQPVVMKNTYLPAVRNRKLLLTKIQYYPVSMRRPSDVWTEQKKCYDVHGSRIAVAAVTNTVPLLP